MSIAGFVPQFAGRAATASVRARPKVVLSSAAVVAVACFTVVVASDVLVYTGWFAVFSAYNVLAFATAGSLWLSVRPQSRVGPLLLLLAGLTAVQSLQGASSSLPFSIGVLADPLSVLLAWYLLLTFPASRLTRPAAALLTLGFAALAVGFAPWFFLSRTVAGGTPLARCTPDCPTNALMIADHPAAAARFGTTEEILAVAFCVGFLLLVGVRLLVATPPRRRVVAAVYAVGAFWTAALGVNQVAAYLVVTDARLYETVGWVLTAARVALPLVFVLALLLAQVFAGRAVETMLVRERLRSGAGELERAARQALGDPTTTLALRPADGNGWTDVAGTPVGDAQAGPNRSSRLLGRDGRVLAELRYDGALDADTAVLDAVAEAILFSLERRSADFEVDRRHDDVAAARMAERRRLEQNLHDTAQQRLLALKIRMALASERLARDPAGADETVASFGGDVDAAIDEIRTIARGLYPPTLASGGLGPALAEAVARHPHVRLARNAVRRHPREVEEAIFFSTLEALQNALKHGGPNADIVVSIWEQDDSLRFEVRDTGHGFDPADQKPEGGLAGVEERLRALTGTLAVTSEPGHGTQVNGAVPV